MKKFKTQEILYLFYWYIPVFVIQTISSTFSTMAIGPWYTGLSKPFWTAPSWVFGPVWVILYLIMTLAVWLVYLEKGDQQLKKAAYALFFAQLFLHGIWSFLFFVQESPLLALIDIIALVIAVGAATGVFFWIKREAGYLFSVYFVWLLYALALNWALYLRN